MTFDESDTATVNSDYPDRLVEPIAELFWEEEFDWIGIYFLKDDRLILGPYFGEKTDHEVIQWGEGICGLAVKKNEDINVPDVSANPNYLACSPKVKSELVTLLRKDGKIIGQIDIDSHTPNAFSPKLVELVRKTADQMEKDHGELIEKIIEIL